MRLTQQLSSIRQLLRELEQPQSVLHEALTRYHTGNYKLWVSTTVLRWGKWWLKQRYPQTTTGLLLQFLKVQSSAYSHPIFINDFSTEQSVRKVPLKFAEAPLIERKIRLS